MKKRNTIIGPIVTKYWYTCILLKEKKRQSGVVDREYHRESGYQFGQTAGEAATQIEAKFKEKGSTVDAITIRLLNESGQILLQTQMAEERSTSRVLGPSLPHTAAMGFYPSEAEQWDDIYADYSKTTHVKNFDVWKYLTAATKPFNSTPTLKVKDHLS